MPRKPFLDARNASFALYSAIRTARPSHEPSSRSAGCCSSPMSASESTSSALIPVPGRIRSFASSPTAPSDSVGHPRLGRPLNRVLWIFAFMMLAISSRRARSAKSGCALSNECEFNVIAIVLSQTPAEVKTEALGFHADEGLRQMD